MSRYMEKVKDCILGFQIKCTERYMDMGMGSEIDSLRSKIITFRDCFYDGDNALEESDFYELPGEYPELDSYLSDIQAYGGGPRKKSSGLEALYRAMHADFYTNRNDRQIIVLFSCDDAYSFDELARMDNDSNDALNQEKFLNSWYCVDQGEDFKLRKRCARLVLFVPEETAYREISRKMKHHCFDPYFFENEEKLDLQDIERIARSLEADDEEDEEREKTTEPVDNPTEREKKEKGERREKPTEFADTRTIVIEMLRTGVQLLKENYDLKYGEGTVDKVISAYGWVPLRKIVLEDTDPKLVESIEKMAKLASPGCGFLEVEDIII